MAAIPVLLLLLVRNKKSLSCRTSWETAQPITVSWRLTGFLRTSSCFSSLLLDIMLNYVFLIRDDYSYISPFFFFFFFFLSKTITDLVLRNTGANIFGCLDCYISNLTVSPSASGNCVGQLSQFSFFVVIFCSRRINQDNIWQTNLWWKYLRVAAQAPMSVSYVIKMLEIFRNVIKVRLSISLDRMFSLSDGKTNTAVPWLQTTYPDTRHC